MKETKCERGKPGKEKRKKKTIKSFSKRINLLIRVAKLKTTHEYKLIKAIKIKNAYFRMLVS